MSSSDRRYIPLDPTSIRRYEESRVCSPQKYLCNSPFANLHFGINGAVRSCSVSPTPLGRYPQNSIKEIWTGRENLALRERIRNHDLSEGCGWCAAQIRSGNYEGVKARVYDDQDVDETYPTSLQFELHNTCNLACVMCSGELSSAIRKKQGLSPQTTPYDEAFVEQLRAFVPHLQKTTFYGGEPFLIAQYYRIWDFLIELNPACAIIVQSNATVLGKRIKAYLERGNFKVGVSLDSINRTTFEKIRVNAHFDRAMANVRFFNDYAAQRMVVRPEHKPERCHRRAGSGVGRAGCGRRGRRRRGAGAQRQPSSAGWIRPGWCVGSAI